MRANKFHYLYVISNDINDMIYVGIHSTEDLNDGYLGSGTNLSVAKKILGKDHFTLNIIKFFGSRKEALLAEKEIVNNEFKNSPLTYNIKRGGLGGWYRPNGYKHTAETRKIMSSSQIGLNNSFYGKKHSQKTLIKMSAKSRKPHSEISKVKISKAKQGENNPMYGKPAVNGTILIIDGIKYSSFIKASEALNLTPYFINKRCLDPNYPNYVNAGK